MTDIRHDALAAGTTRPRVCAERVDGAAIDAAVRVRAGESLGSGAIFEVSDDRAWVLTCAHVVEGRRDVEVEFWHRGHGSRPLPGVVVAAEPNVDAAVVAVPIARLGNVPIAVAPFGPAGETVPANAPIYSTGSANGTWPTMFLGHSVGYTRIGLEFVPPPANGRSGSAVLDEQGRIVGILRARREGGDAVGIATPIQEVYRVWGTSAQRRAASEALCAVVVPAGPVQCPGGTCPSPQPGPRYDFQRQFPWPGNQRRQYDEGYGDGRGDAWPTLPPPTLPPPATAPRIDIDIAPPAKPEPPNEPAPRAAPAVDPSVWTWKAVVSLSAGSALLALLVAMMAFAMAHAIHTARYARRALKGRGK